MAMVSDRWQEITPSQFPWEREALGFIRDRLPDHDPYRVWSNFEFIADDGSVNEVDLLVVTPAGFFMVEIKSKPGTLHGDNSTWKWTDENGRVRTQDNPLLLTSRKTKKFISLLRRQKAFAKVACPYLDELVFCSAENLEIRLSGPASNRVCPRDDEASSRKGIMAALMDRACPGLKPDVRRIDRPVAKAIGRGIEQMGIRPSQRSRRVGDFILGDLLFQCPKDTYQEWEATHASVKSSKRRVRIYTVGAHEGQAARSVIERAAEHEFRFLEQLEHEGILRAEQFTMHELGPALLFRHEPTAVRLDHFLAEHGENLSVDLKLSLVRQIAEALRFAHAKGIVHRTLSPQSILVHQPDSPKPRTKIFNWQLGRQYINATTSSSWRNTYSIHPEQLVEDASLLYMAPECVSAPEGAEPYVDVFSLGAITYHIFAGVPPASSGKELSQKLSASRGLDISAVSDGAGTELCELVKFSTDPVVHDRLDSVTEFLDLLERVEDELTAPDEEAVDNPLDATVGDVIEGGFKVKKRLGAGGSATAFLVDDHGKERVLKIANKPEYTDRLKAEYRTLRKLRHPLIVEAHEMVEAGELAGFTVQYAGEQTLAQRLQQDGQMQPEFLQRFGEDLLDILKHLEEHGVYHRDIKPDNIGIGYPTSKGKLRLQLFDFSLSSTSLDNVRAGTVRYRDPFLESPAQRNYDLYAERFSAAMTLYEMATGALPKWSDDNTNPAHLTSEVMIQADCFEPALRAAMQEFFAKALRRDYRRRYDNADEMLRAWRAVFENVGKATTTTTHDGEFDQAKAIEAADKKTQLVTLGLSTRAMTAMDRLNALTVEDFLRIPTRDFRYLRGVGKKTQDEIIRLSHDLHRKFPDVEVDERTGEGPSRKKGADKGAKPEIPLESLSIDALCRDVCSTGGKEGSASRAILMGFLGLDEAKDLPKWPNQSQLGRHCGVTRARVGQVITKAREQWRRMPSVTQVRDDLAKIVSEYGGVMTAGDVAASIRSTRGSVSEGVYPIRRALAVVRASIEAERGNQEQRFTDFRPDDVVLVAQDASFASYAQNLGPIADELADHDPLLAPARVTEELRKVRLPEGAAGIRLDRDVVCLAAAMSKHASVSGRLELYPKGMPAVRVLRLAAGVLTGSRELTLEEIQKRVKSRYPESAALPVRPELDEILQDIGLDVAWDASAAGGVGAYRFRHIEEYTLSSGSYGTGITSGEGVSVTETEAEIRLFERKLDSAAREGAFLVLSAAPRYLLKAERKLRDRFDLEIRNLDRLVITALREKASEKRVNWPIVLKADSAGHDSRDWGKLNTLVGMCIPEIKQSLGESERTLLLTYPGLLARYSQMTLFDELRDMVGVTGGKLHGVWALIPDNGDNPLPSVDGQAVPVLSSGQHAKIPSAWLKERAGRD